MHLNFDPSILDQMTEGVILLDRQAVIVSANKAAQFWLASCRQLAPVLKRLMDEEVAGRLHLPVAIDKLVGAHAASKIQTKAWLCKNGHRDYAIFIVPPRLRLKSEPVAQAIDKRFVALFGDQIRHQIADVRASIGEHGAAPAEASLRQKIEHLDFMLAEISKLSELMQRDQVFGAERIELNALLADLLAQEAAQHSVRHVFTPGSAPQGVLYGDVAWLTYALRVLIQALWRGAPPQSHLVISTRQLGDFIIVSGQTGFGSVPAHATARSLPAPGNEAASAWVAQGHAAARMALCQRIVELHSGFLKVSALSAPEVDSAEPGQGVESFVLTLLSGLPEHERSRVSCSDCRLNLQAQAYAKDIAQLLEQLEVPAA